MSQEPDNIAEENKPDTMPDTDVAKSLEFEEKYKRALADYLNLERRAEATIRDGINQKMDVVMRDFLNIYDDFERARDVYKAQEIDTSGLDSILKNATAMLTKNNITPMNAVGDVLDTNLHEPMRIVEKPDLEENTVIKELRKGYIINNRVLRTALVEVSTKGGES
ncbi:MAG: nucleotide exchange factor GrpE [Cenarchaeum sp. SB0665_bin_23]|nr:nucleotide exchange factor GrpE [Cenarchaeum sp. SB0665_bin_23]MYG33136.1 nucleotide exchange factor GrpE [Cenarchaeum sp. SB0677_bin_16]